MNGHNKTMDKPQFGAQEIQIKIVWVLPPDLSRDRKLAQDEDTDPFSKQDEKSCAELGMKPNDRNGAST